MHPTTRTPGHRLLVRAVLGELADGAEASHVSAAVWDGVPTWGLRLDRAHVTFARRTGGRRDDRLYVHTASLEPDEIVVIDDVRVTSAARTVVDVARTVEFAPAVARPTRPCGPGDVVYAEKQREDAIRAEDWEVVRWTWADLHDFTDTAARIRDRFRS